MNLSDQLKSIATAAAVDAGANISPTMQDCLDKSNKAHSRNGDPQSYHLESIAIKLQFALQGDLSCLADINDEELHSLIRQIHEAQEISNVRDF
jgi:hypothetical protein